jgi:hypothetical protein
MAWFHFKIYFKDVCIGLVEMRNVYKIMVTKLKGRDHLEDPGIDWRIILK